MTVENNKEKKLPSPEKIKGIETKGDYEDFTQQLVDPNIKEALKAATDGPLDIGYPGNEQTYSYNKDIADALKKFDQQATDINGAPLPGFKKITDQYAPSTVDKPSGLEIAPQRKIAESVTKTPSKSEEFSKITSPIDKLKAIFRMTDMDKDGKKIPKPLHIKFETIKKEMIDKPAVRLVDLFAVLNWTELNKDVPMYEDNVAKLQNVAFLKLLQVLETSPDPKKWDTDLQELSKTQGVRLSTLIEQKMNISSYQLENAKDYMKSNITQEQKNLFQIKSKLDEFLGKLPA